MAVISDFLTGFETAMQPEALLFCFIGVTIGTGVGALPGIGALAAVSIALPLTFHMDPSSALIMLAGIFYGAQYGSSTASILLNIPGSASAAVTCLDGYALTQRGRSGMALFVTSVASFVGGSFAIVLLMAFAPAIANFALRFSAAEYFTAMLLGLVAASTISNGSALKGLVMVLVGIALSFVGTDVNSGVYRFTFGMIELADGLSLVAVAMGLFGIAEILSSVGRAREGTLSRDVTFRSMIPTREETRDSVMPTVRGSVIGSLIGALPGAGPTIAAFMAYAVEKRVARDPSRFGTGIVEGVAAPEAANNAAVQSAFIPTLSLGIPGDSVMAVLMGAMLLHGIIPGPQFVTSHPDIFWGLIASFWIGNILLLILNIPLIGLWVRLLTIPYRIMYPALILLICVGTFSVRNSLFDVYIAALFGVVGYVLMQLRYPAAPLLLGFVLGPLIEEHFRRALIMSRGDLSVFLTRPISAAFMVFTAALLLFAVRSAIRGQPMKPVQST